MGLKAERFQFSTIFEAEYLARHDPIYSQAQMDQIIEEHFNKGVETGKMHAQSGIDAINTHHLQQIHGTLHQITAIQQEMLETLEGHVSTVCREITTKMLPTLAEKGALDEIMAVVDLAFKSYDHASEFTIHVGETYKDGLNEKLNHKMEEQQDFRFKIVEDEALGPSECRIEWETGGVERLLGYVQNQVESALNRLTAAADYRRQELHAAATAHGSGAQETPNEEQE